MLEIVSFTLGPAQTNAYLVADFIDSLVRDGSDSALAALATLRRILGSALPNCSIPSNFASSWLCRNKG